jgi:hypothetical protein
MRQLSVSLTPIVVADDDRPYLFFLKRVEKWLPGCVGLGVWGAMERKRHLSRDRRFGCRQPINRHPMHAERLGDFAGGLAFSQQRKHACAAYGRAAAADICALRDGRVESANRARSTGASASVGAGV